MILCGVHSQKVATIVLLAFYLLQTQEEKHVCAFIICRYLIKGEFDVFITIVLLLLDWQQLSNYLYFDVTLNLLLIREDYQEEGLVHRSESTLGTH